MEEPILLKSFACCIHPHARCIKRKQQQTARGLLDIALKTIAVFELKMKQTALELSLLKWCCHEE
jgi:hypothetical protein